MNFGTAWESYMGACDQKTTESILDYFYEQGGNFVDTANNVSVTLHPQRLEIRSRTDVAFSTNFNSQSSGLASG